MHRNSTRENRETPQSPAAPNEAGRREKAMSNKPLMHGGGESYSGVVPAKQPNKGGRPLAEVVEERPLAKENAEQPNLYRTPSRESGPIQASLYPENRWAATTIGDRGVGR